MRCTYPGCRQEAPENDELCIFHLPVDRKKIELDQFNQAIMRLLNAQDVDFTGFIFPGPISFEGKAFRPRPIFERAVFMGAFRCPGVEFMAGADFSHAEFNGEVDFGNAVFKADANYFKAKFQPRSPLDASSKGIVRFNDTRFEGIAGFEKAIFSSGNTSFMNAKFQGDTCFLLARFVKGDADFRFAVFTGKSVLFNGAHFNGGNTDFSACQFLKSAPDFHLCEFNGGYTCFIKTIFSKAAQFNDCRFSGGIADFNRAIFSDGSAEFISCRFSGGDADFTRCRLSGGADFTNAEFTGGKCIFSDSAISKELEFRNNVISRDFVFHRVRLEADCVFLFAKPKFQECMDIAPIISFSRVRFNPFLTYFEDVIPGKNFAIKSVLEKPLIIFRLCYLRDVYFTNNDMCAFSFFNSSFYEEALFISCHWTIRRERIIRFLRFKYCHYNRQNIIFEESIFDDMTNDIATKLGMELLENYGDIAAIYMRMKTAADRAKDYHLASWFYFNEIEMKRRDLLAKAKTTGKWWKTALKTILTGRLWTYNLYKIFAGYGEKPGWSFSWFLMTIAIFAVINLYNGFNSPIGKINYDLAVSLPNIGTLVRDIGYSIIYTLYRVIPTAFLSGSRDQFSLINFGIWDFILSIMNSVVPVILLVLTGVGLKRHFRRF